VHFPQRLLAWICPHYRKVQLRDQEAAAEVVKRLRELRNAGTLTPVPGSDRKLPDRDAKEQLGPEKNGTWH
jgi:hypothetical protein